MDSHSVSKGNEEASGSNINGESESHLHMDCNLYDAAAEGDVEPFKNMANDVIESLVTVTNNTILHINIIAQSQYERKAKFVEEILHLCPSLLLKVNDQGDTPLHVAVKYGRADIVGVLIKRAKSQPNDEDDIESGIVGAIRCRKMIGMLNKIKNTALHEAVCCGSLDIVKILVKEVPEFPYSANSDGETPLYIAAARNSRKIVTEILDNCQSPAHQGPCGKTALHEAIMGFLCSADLVKLIVEKKKSLIRDRDQYGWTPLHYAAYFRATVHMTKELLEYDRSAACTTDKDHKMTPLHLAAAQGHEKIVYLIISDCPECCQLLDARGWNVLHFAMVSFNARQLKILLTNPFVRSLLNKKDVNGNTPLHVLAVFCRDRTYRILPPYIRGHRHAVNKQNRSVLQIMDHGSPELKQEIQKLSKGDENGQYPRGFIEITKDKRKKNKWNILDEDVFGAKEAAASQLVVAALIATVTYAAGFTLPGGYKNEEGPNQGTAILSRKSAFQAFVITDTIAMVLSLSAIFFHFIMSLKAFKDLILLFVFSLLFTLVAMIAMVIAFITGAYAMLSPSLGLAIPTCFIGLSFFLLIFYLLYKALEVKAAENTDDFEF